MCGVAVGKTVVFFVFRKQNPEVVVIRVPIILVYVGYSANGKKSVL